MTFGVRVLIDDQPPVFLGDYMLLGVAVAKAETAVRIAIDEPDMDAESFASGRVVVLDLETGVEVYQASTRVFSC
jgi:hypothetical protein